MTYDAVFDDLRQRDARDSARATAPLKPADDAVLLDTSEMTIDEAVKAAIAIATDQMKDSEQTENPTSV